MLKNKVHPSWLPPLTTAIDPSLLTLIGNFLQEEAASGKVVYPPAEDVFSAFRMTPLSDVKVVILGQDPYHGEGQAHGLAFSVNQGVRIPPSLRNIYKELESEYGRPSPTHGYLTDWATQGVLLLNTSLTVEKANAGSHSKIGWQKITDAAIKIVSDHCPHVVFLLWGSHAQAKKPLIDESKHLILESVHPSPLSAYRGFFGCNHFLRANNFLESKGLPGIKWI